MSLLVAVTTCHSYDYRDKGNAEHPNGANPRRVEIIRDTWAKRNCGLDIRYFYGRGANREPLPDEVFLDVPDDYFRLPQKTQGIFKWALANGYDGLLKVDDDTFINLPYFLSSDFGRHDYVGNVVPQEVPFASGFAYYLSERSMEWLTALDLDFSDFGGKEFNHADLKWADDKWVGWALHHAGIFPHHDPRYQVCLCDVCWHGYTDQIAVHVTPFYEMMYELCRDSDDLCRDIP